MSRISACFCFVFLLLLSACRMGGQKPLIGISSSHTEADQLILATTYPEAVREAGGVPLVIPLVETDAQAREAVARVDGLIFTGGADLNPAWYGEAVLNETVEIDSVRDYSDSLLARAALREGKPVLAICRGAQLFNVLAGGSLYQDIPSQVGGYLPHQDTTHLIGLGKGFLQDIWQQDSVRVNSLHHQAVKDLAPGFEAVAWAADGVVEAYEDGQVWAVQFHPEKLRRTVPEWGELFRRFIGKCK